MNRKRQQNKPRRPAPTANGGFGMDLVLDTAAAVIERANRERPADAVLRAILRSTPGLMQGDYTDTTRAVFAYYRWLGWLNLEQPLRDRLRQALELAETYAAGTRALDQRELMERAIPAWVKPLMQATPAWAHELQREPRLWLRARKGLGSTLARQLGDTRTTTLPDVLIYEGEQDLFRTPEFSAGEFEIQDLASQIVGLLCDPQPGETWWDGCAGEGGKLLHLSDLMENKGLIWATDRSERRLQKLRQRAARAKCFNYRAALWDGSARLPTRTKFDGILIDAPCSGIGTWQRNPHARWTATLQDVEELAAIQLQLLQHAAKALKPGGRLVYSVCTLAQNETTGVVEQFGRACPELTPIPLMNPLLSQSPPVPHIWMWPQDFHCNGMFIAAWKRNG